jgi:hypothetical protein
LVTALQDLAAGNVTGFGEELLNYVPATDIIVGEVAGAFGLDALLSIANGTTLDAL